MANLAQIQSIAQGQFFVKDSLGNLTELKVGDTVSLNDTIVAASSNTDLSKIEILFDTNELITLSQGEQLLDATLLASTFGNEELAFDKQEVDETLNAWNNAQDGDATDMETAAGDVTEQATNAGDERAADGGALRSKFNSRDGDATDIVSDLREASWTGGIERTIEDSENMLLEDPLPVVYTIIEGIDVVNEGDSANYVVKLQDAAGNPVIATQDTIIYVRYTNKTTQDGDTQYNNENIIEVVIKAGTSQTEFTIKTNDDYLADNGEIYNVAITGNNSTEFDMRTGDVAGNKTNVDTTILDNTTDKPNENSTVESDQENVILKIVAADKDGNPIKDTNGDYLTVNEVPEGNNAYYVVLAFEPNTTKFNDNTKLDIQSGTVEVETSNKTASGVNSQTKDDGTEDYISKKEIVELGKPISVKTLDDWKSDNNEQFEIKITDKTYQHPSTPVYENVVTDKNPVTTTIKDDTDITPNNPNDNKIETNQEQVILKIVACDSTGNPIMDGNKYTFVNEVNEGSNAKYMVLAFDPKATEFTTTTVLNSALQGGTVTIKTVDGTAITTGTKDNAELDYKSETTKEVTLGTVFEVETLDDYLADDNETFKVSINDSSYKHPSTPIYENVKTDTNPVTTTIKDNTTPNTETDEEVVKIILVATDSTGKIPLDSDGKVDLSKNTNETPEGGKLYYIAVAVDKDGKPLATQGGDVTINYGTTPTASDKDATAGVDYDNTTKVTTKVGVVFEVKTNDDYYAEGDENFTVRITDLKNSPYETPSIIDTTKDTVTSTIKDNAPTINGTVVSGGEDTNSNTYGSEDTVYAIITGETTVNEGGVVTYTVKLVDKDGNTVIPTKETTVTVTYTNIGTTSTDDTNKVNNETITVKIDASGKGTFTVETKDDYYAEADENYNVKITNVQNTGEFENVKFDSYPNNPSNNVTTTIKDNPAKVEQPDTGTEHDDPINGSYGKEDTVYVKIVGNAEVVEGGNLVHNIQLIDKDGKSVIIPDGEEITVTLTYTTNHDIKDSDFVNGSNQYNETTKTITVTIDKNTPKDENGIYKLPITNKTQVDFDKESTEKYQLEITNVKQSNGTFENVVIGNPDGTTGKSVTGTILDGITFGTPVDSKVDEDNFYQNDLNGTDGGNVKKINLTASESLGITIPNDYENTVGTYTINFAGNPTVDGVTKLTSDGKDIHFQTIGNKIIAYIGTDVGNGTVKPNNKVFEIVLNKSTGKYDYTQYKNIDHPKSGNVNEANGKENYNDNDNIDLNFKFNITTTSKNGQTVTSPTQEFKVTVNDSTPDAGTRTETVNEDGTLTIVLSDEGFQKDPKDPFTKGQIEIDNGKDGYQTLVKKGTANIYDGNEVIGVLKNNANGTLTFKPNADYSKYEADNGYLPNFKYKVSDTDGDYAQGQINIHVKPVADGTKIEVKNVETYEDNKNTQEGQNSVSLGLVQPTIKDNKDKNDTAKGDHGERVEYITLKFTNGASVKGAVLEKADGTDILTITKNTDKVKIVIVKDDGTGKMIVDTDFHHSNVDLGQSGVVYLTKEEYEGLKIQHAEDNDTDIKITINVKSYEVDDSGKPLNASDSTYADKTNSHLSKTTTANMTVIIKPVTDDISLKWNDESAGTIFSDGKTFVFNKDIIKEEGIINFKELLTNTSGTTDGTNGTEKGDLDGSEIRWYTVKFEGDSKDHPDYLIINGKTVSLSNGEYKYEFTASENTKADPDFKVQFPNGYSGGTLKGELTLHVQDRGVEEKNDSSKWGEELKQTVKFEVAVNPVADDATVKVGQPVGYEDAGRSQGNTSKIGADASKIDKPENGIRLPIEVTSTDKDGSETFTVTIKDIPNGSGLYVYDKSSVSYKLVEVSNVGTITIDGQAVTGDKSGNISVTLQQDGKFAVEIKDYQNTEQPKFIPPHNSHGDFDLKVDAKTVDTVVIDGNPVPSENTTAIDKPIKVVVKDVADPVVGNEYNEENLSTDTNYKKPDERQDSTFNKVVDEADAETNGISLNSIFKYSTELSSYDKESEDLTIVIKDLPAGVTLEGANVNYVNGQYIFKVTDIDGITIKTHVNYSGELNFDITYITTEKGEANNPSKTFDSKKTTDSVSIFVKPTVDAGFKSNTTKAEDMEAEKVDSETNSYYKLDLGISHQNGDNDETLESVKLDKPDDGEFKLFIKNIDGSFSEITDFTKTYTEDVLKNIYVQAPENKHGDFNLSGSFVAKDSQNGLGNSVNYEATKTENFTHTLTITPVTDTPTIEVESGTQTHINVNARENTEIKIPVKVTSADKDGSENITKIVISGVPQGVTISFGDAESDAKVTVSEHNGIYTIVPKDGNYKLNDADFKNITFNVTSGANFEHRDITITAYTKDAQGSSEESTSTVITLDKSHTGTGGGNGSGIGIELKDGNPYKATEDTEFNFLDVFKVVVADGGSGGRVTLNFTLDSTNATIKGLTANANGSYTITGNRADIESVLANLKVVPNKDYNDNHTTDKSTLDITVTIDGKTPVIAKVPVVPVTDAMSIKVEATPTDLAGIVENKPVDLKITLINSVDGKHTEEIKSITIKVTETWKDNAIGEVTEKGLLTDTRGNYKINENLDGTYTITKKDGTSFDFTEIKDLQYTPTTNRNGDVSFDVIVNHKEIDGKATMDTLEDGSRNAIGSKVITVKPVVSSTITITDKEVAEEDKGMASAKLTVEKYDPSEKFESVLIKVASGVAVYYDNGTKLAMNLGGGSWLIPVSGDGKTLPEIFFKGKEHLGGEIDFTATINAKDGEAKVTKELTGSVTITEVADGVTIDPTKTGIDKNAFEWTTLNLNANMKDIDGSEKMHFTLEGLDSSAQFRVNNGDGTYTDLSSKASQDATGKWTIDGIEAKDINSIEISHDKSVSGVKVEAWTVDGDNVSTSPSVSGTFDLSYKADAKFSNGSFTLAKDMDIDFNNIGKLGFTNVEKIDLGAGNGKNELLNLTLQDVLDIGKKDGGNINLTILGDSQDKVTFADKSQWQKSDTPTFEGGKTFTEWSNTSDSTVTLKIEQPISDGITN